jgi:hypothetical protein
VGRSAEPAGGELGVESRPSLSICSGVVRDDSPWAAEDVAATSESMASYGRTGEGSVLCRASVGNVIHRVRWIDLHELRMWPEPRCFKLGNTTSISISGDTDYFC